MVGPFSILSYGRSRPLLSYLLMPPARRAMALSLVSIGSSTRGRKHVTFLEFFPIVIALRIWGPLMANSCVIFNTDNAALVDIMNHHTSKNKFMMILVRDLVLTSLRHNIMFRARHIQGVHNTPADYISGFPVDKFKELCPEVDEFPTTMPESLLPESWSLI